MATIFDPNAFDDVTHDESAGLQTSGVPNTDTGEDNDDDDILLSSIGSLLTTLTGLGAPATAIGAARNQVLTFVGDADPELSFRLAGDVTTLASGLMTNADSTLDSDNLRDPITLVVINDTTIFGYANYGLTGQRVAFALVLSETSTGAEITIVQYEALFNTNPSSPDDFLNLAGLVYVDASESFDFDDFSAAPAGQNLWTSVSDSSGTVEILVTGLSLGTDTVNTRATSLGSNNQSIEPGEGLRFDFVDGQALPTSTTAKDLTNIGYTSRIEGDTGGFTMAQVGGSPNNRVSAQVTAYDSSDTASDFSDGGGLSGTVQTIVKVEVYLGNTLISSWQRTSATTGTETTPTGGDAVLEYRVTDFDSVTIDGLKTNYRVSFTVADVDGIGGDDTGAMDRFVVQNVSTGSGNKSFDLGNIRLSSSEADSAEVGTFIRFEDDGPTATIALGTGSVTHDETAGVQNAAMTLPADAGDLDDNDQSGALPAVFNGIAGTLIGWARSAAAVVTTTGSAYGADSVGGTTALSLKVTGFTAGTGVDSGIDTTNGTNIFLYEETGRVVGKVGATEAEAKTGAVAFAIAIGNDGFLSTAQYLSLKHLDPATLIAGDVSSYDEAVSLAENLLKAVVTVTDGDLDVRTAEVAVGDRVRFEDDGPTAAIARGTGSVTHDETAGVQNAAMTLPADAGDLDDNDQSGALPAAFNGIAGTLIGWARSSAAVVTTTGTGYGADTVGGTTALSLQVTGFANGTGVDSGIDTTNGTNIFLYEETGRVVGKVGATEAEAKTGAVAFAIAIAIGNDGFLSTAQYLSLKHLDPATLIAGDVSSYDEAVSLAENLLKAVVTVTDGDLDVRTAEVGVGDRVRFEDDGPLPIDPEHATLTNAAGLPATFLLDEDLVPTSFADNYGQDGPETTYRGVVFAGSAADDGAALYAADTTSPQLTSDGLPIYLEGFGTATLTAYTGSGLTKQTIFTVSLDGSSGEYSVDMEAKIDNGSISFDNFGSGGAGLRYWLGVAGTEDASKDLLVTGATPNTNTINNDSDDIATGNQWIDPSEMVRLDFVSGIGTTTGTSDVNNIPPASHYLVNDVGFTVMQTKANSQVDVRIAAIDAARDIDGTDGTDGTSVTADLLAGTLDTITSVSVIDGTTGIETVYERSAAVQVGTVWRSSDGKVLWDDNTDGNGLNDNRDVIVFNIDAPTTTTRDQVFVSTANGFTRLEITNVDPSNQHALAIGGFDVGGDAGEPVELEFDVNVVDGDGDAAVGLIGITLNPETVV